MEDAPTMRIRHVFADRLVSASDLNRRSSAILDMALQGPVTITRNDQHFALLRRDLAAHMSAVADQVALFSEAIQALRTTRVEGDLPEHHPFQWMKAFDEEHLQDMENDLIECLEKVVSETDLEAVETSLLKWRAHAVSMLGGVMGDGFDVGSSPSAPRFSC